MSDREVNCVTCGCPRSAHYARDHTFYPGPMSGVAIRTAELADIAIYAYRTQAELTVKPFNAMATTCYLDPSEIDWLIQRLQRVRDMIGQTV